MTRCQHYDKTNIYPEFSSLVLACGQNTETNKGLVMNLLSARLVAIPATGPMFPLQETMMATSSTPMCCLTPLFIKML